MEVEEVPFTELLSKIVDNRGRTCPTAETGLPLIATNCVRNDLLYPAFEKVRYVSKETYENWFRGHPVPGDLIFVCKGTPGRVCMTPDPVSFCIAQDMVAVRADPKKVYPRYLFALLRSPQVQAQIGNMHVGTLIPHFKKGDFDKLLLPVPDKKTQETIGDTYFELSDKIELNRRMNATLESMARALFQSWFVDFDPVRAKLDGRQPAGIDATTAALFPTALEHSEWGLKPSGWQIESLGDLCPIITDGAHRSPKSVDAGLPMASVKDMNNWGIDISSCRKISVTEFQILIASGCQPKQGDVLLAKDGATCLETVCEYRQSDPIVLLSSVAILRPRLKALSSFLHIWLGLDSTKSYLKEGFVSGSAIPRVVLRDLRRARLVVPDDNVLNAFDHAVSPLRAQVWMNVEQSSTLATVRDTLLPKLLSGELSVADLNHSVGVAKVLS